MKKPCRMYSQTELTFFHTTTPELCRKTGYHSTTVRVSLCRFQTAVESSSFLTSLTPVERVVVSLGFLCRWKGKIRNMTELELSLSEKNCAFSGVRVRWIRSRWINPTFVCKILFLKYWIGLLWKNINTRNKCLKKRHLNYNQKVSASQFTTRFWLR